MCARPGKIVGVDSVVDARASQPGSVVGVVVNLREQLTNWGGDLFEFSNSELAASMAFIDGYGELVSAQDTRTVTPLVESDRLLLLTDIAVFVWLDDTFEHAGERTPVPWAQLAPGTSHTNREARVFDRLHVAMRDRGGDREALELWRRTGVAFLELQERDWATRRGHKRREWTFLDYLLEAEVNSSTQHMLATLSLLHGLDMHARMEEPVFRSYLRNIGVLARLLNDLSSVERERHEAAPRNVLLFLEDQVDGDGARSIIQTRVREHREHLARDRALLGSEDPLADAGLLMLAAIERIYALPGVRYEPH